MNEIRCPECGSLFSIDESSYASNVLNATAKLIVVYGDALNDEVFKEKVGAVSIKAINQDFEFRDTEAPVTHEVSFFVADQSFHNLIALFVQQLDVSDQRPGAAGYIHGHQPGSQLHLGHRVLFVRLLAQNLHNLQELDFLVVLLRHGWPPLTIITQLKV